MAYQALYRVWRSQRFDDIVGQKAVTQTLKNAIVSHKTSHAYLFTGPRGTGKTSAAKIFAKAINCPNSQDGEPCNECEMCRSITAGTQEDVIEIDAASNNGVEEIRFIRDRANYAPTKATYKVYIIDEVHMLSTGAFNALLKTLEEPKESVIFILATTEPHKIPATIISRTQRFDFKRINASDIVEHLEFILNESNISYEEQALGVIARAAEGGMRDALSILDQSISFSEGTITLNDAMQVTGSLTYEMMDDYLSACVEQNVAQALNALEQMLAAGKEARRFLEDLLQYCRDLLMYQQAPQLVTEKTSQLTPTFVKLSQEMKAEQLFQMIKILSETQNEIRFTNSATIYLEVATVKLAQKTSLTGPQALPQGEPAESQAVEKLQQEVSELKKELKALKSNQGTANNASQPAPQVVHKKQASSYRVPTERVYQVLKEATRQDLNQVKEVWDDLLMSLSVTQRAMLKASEPVAAGPKSMVIAFDYEIVCQRATNDDELQLAIHNNLSRMIHDYAPDTVYITRESWPELRKNYLIQSKDNGQSTSFVPETDEEEIELIPQEPETVETVVAKAEELFGTDSVTIIDD
ncbi:DNA polymerase III subunit gamma/tau [Enterococcus thailandicus]|uniref:DNA polymerase III subunit gamma/tau n=1 Tax=Enterococcus TaxID=1350 RepID=UPI000BAEAE2F|nr:DNA polymerase III subunit gamma/tau [Enterococcus thailandicus]ASZ08046.1 DNA polymerase III subunit gamma/tau [Enterococcus thailandicus]MDA3964218.1 DNA polymerase III subunit gamma/tau [Enterococcus thailandicus]MDK4352992.1 DNA polymerase III subunit gamma/tau [Enterococcus thailandicus]MDT2734174.1 DNA polymerase III subunit gamma/tau [Enterococcus thailandicus]MDT2752267.1 DNA polymerase III subunit gamma/tau [Enterococcus thailandicus]